MIRFDLRSPLDRSDLYAAAKWLRRYWRDATDPVFIDIPFVRTLVRCGKRQAPADTAQQEASFGILEELGASGLWRIANHDVGRQKQVIIEVYDQRKNIVVMKLRVK